MTNPYKISTYSSFKNYSIILSLLLISCNTPNKASESSLEAPNSKPNIILIFTDDQGYQDLGVFGSPDILTPNLDNMAREGVQFTNFYVAQAVCSASRAAILTGSYSNRVGIHGALDHKSEHGLNPNETTIADLLKTQGYATSIIGKWHLGHHPEFLPTKQGFDEFYGIPYSNDMWPHHPENPNYYPPLPLYKNDSVIDTLDDQSQLTTKFTEVAVDFIKRNKDSPFFLYLAHPMPHVPLFVSEKFKGKSDRGLYGDVIMEIDWSVGEILAALKENGLDDNTLVIFTSDNGPWLSYGGHSGSAKPLREGKGTSWEGGIRVPAIMKWPDHLPKGKIQSEPIMTIDILPTVAYLTGCDLPKHKIDGLNVWPLISMQENAVSPHEAYFIYYNRNELQSVLMGKWKMYLPHAYRTIPADQPFKNDGIPVIYEMVKIESPELYHVDNDMSESLNVADENPEIVERMLQIAEKAREDLGDALTNNPGKNLREPGRSSEK